MKYSDPRILKKIVEPDSLQILLATSPVNRRCKWTLNYKSGCGKMKNYSRRT